VGLPHPWPDFQPSDIDAGRFDAFSIRSSRETRPNGSGIYGLCGTVWEWTADLYDALAYTGRTDGAPTLRALRGGSWADDVSVCTVSVRNAEESKPWAKTARFEAPLPSGTA
jgi:formylglycine-generating enzyme required for sulfatase activity